jgi:hypothetical protein
MSRKLFAGALLLLIGPQAFAHRLDEYLQGTILSVGKSRLEAQLTLTPGVAVFPFLMAVIDTDSDGTISEAERRAYVKRVLSDLSITIDGHSLAPHLTSTEFPPVGEMKEGRGKIRIEFNADLPHGGASRKLIIENRHQRRISAYQVNVLVPRDPDIRIVSQNRNYSQSFYELDYQQAGVHSDRPVPGIVAGSVAPLGAVALLVIARLALASNPRRARKS